MDLNTVLLTVIAILLAGIFGLLVLRFLAWGFGLVFHKDVPVMAVLGTISMAAVLFDLPLLNTVLESVLIGMAGIGAGVVIYRIWPHHFDIAVCTGFFGMMLGVIKYLVEIEWMGTALILFILSGGMLMAAIRGELKTPPQGG